MSFQYQLTYNCTSGAPFPVPPGIEQVFLPTPSGVLEIHRVTPDSFTNRPPILFVHGGFGSAFCYKNYLPFFAAHGYPAYAVSLRGHGNSFHPGYWKLYITPRQRFVEDVASAIRYVRQEHGVDPILAGHSAGGGVSQDLIAQGLEKVQGLVTLAAIPGYGSLQVNWNWMKFDVWMMVRMCFHLFHPRSPLSSTKLVHRAFFSPNMPTSAVIEVEKVMAPTESMSWPMGMARRFVDPRSVIANLGDGRILVIAGEKDRLMTFGLMQRLAEWYQAAARALKSDDNSKVTLRVVGGVGHHLMLDVNWKEGAERILEWLGSSVSPK